MEKQSHNIRIRPSTAIRMNTYKSERKLGNHSNAWEDAEDKARILERLIQENPDILKAPR